MLMAATGAAVGVGAGAGTGTGAGAGMIGAYSIVRNEFARAWASLSALDGRPRFFPVTGIVPGMFELLFMLRGTA